MIKDVTALINDRFGVLRRSVLKITFLARIEGGS
jgi:hypothetical protein